MDVRYELKRKEATESQRLLCNNKDYLADSLYVNYFADAVLGVVCGFGVAYAYADAVTFYSAPTAYILGVMSLPVFAARVLGEKRALDLQAEVDSLEHKMHGLKKYLVNNKRHK